MRAATLAMLGLFLAVVPAWADDPLVLTGTKSCTPYQYLYQNCPPGNVPANPTAPTDPNKPADPNAQQPQAPDQFSGATEAGTQPAGMFNPNMFGDLIGVFGTQRVTFPTRQGATPVVRQVRGVPIAGQYGGFMITDDESPRPVDRIYFSYNNYAEVNRSLLGPGVPNVSLNQELVGFEKTFLDGDASFGVRLPFIQVGGGFDQFQSQIWGDLSLILKFAWINDRTTGNVFSTGMVLTVPTGGGNNFLLPDGTTAPNATLFQPWAGWIYNLQNAYFQGFSSIVIPGDSRDPTILSNSFAAGYWLYRDRQATYLQGFVPTVELYLNNPLNHSNSNDLIFFQNQVNLTTGAYVIFPRMTIGAAVCVPLVGPKPYSIEAIANLNIRF